MPRYLAILSTILLAIGLPCPAAASRVFVPTGVATIQAAIDGGADSIEVLDSATPERLTLARCVVIEAVSGQVPYLAAWSSTPRIRSLEILPSDSYPCTAGGIVIRGVRFLGKVDASSIQGGNSITFEACRFDSGFAGPNNGIGTSFEVLSVRGCLFLGDAKLSGYVQFIGNTVIGGTLRIRADGVHDIRDNYVQGPAAAGMELHLQESLGQVARNSVRGTIDGIQFIGNGFVSASQNDIADCSGTGIDFHSGDNGGARCDSNSVARCGGVGILVRSDSPSANPGAKISGNVVRQTGLDGISLPHGLIFAARGNVVLDAGENGFTAALADSFEGNVIGRSHGVGARIGESYRIAGNTVFSSGGVGFDIQESLSGNQLTHNVSAFNGAPGLTFHGSHAPQLSCNDWFGNSGGQTAGLPASYADISVNPRFCDLGGADVHLSASSPLLNDPSCGLIGALGQGCGTTTEVPKDASGVATTFHAWPTPARGTVTFALPTSTSPSQVEVFDVAGAQRWQSTIPAGTARVEWDRRENSGQLVAPGVYFARLRRQGANIARVRVVVTE